MLDTVVDVLVVVVVGCMLICTISCRRVVCRYTPLSLHNSFASLGAYALECLYIQLVRAHALEC